MRSFPRGTKNCYTLKLEQGKSNNYLIRAFFYYGNYDNKNQIPKFDLYVGVNYWFTVELDNVSYIIYPDIIHVPTSDTIYVCLINTGSGVPFISALELRPLDKSLYSIGLAVVNNGWRYDMGTSSDKVFVRWISYSFFFFFFSQIILLVHVKFGHGILKGWIFASENFNATMTLFSCSRYKNDVYDHFWYSFNKFSNWVPINTSLSIDV